MSFILILIPLIDKPFSFWKNFLSK